MPTTVRTRGLVLTEHEFSIPLDHARKDGERSPALVARQAAVHQSWGFCSDHPGLGELIGCSAIAVAKTLPRSLQMSVFVPLVPMSMPSRCAIFGAKYSVRGRAW